MMSLNKRNKNMSDYKYEACNQEDVDEDNYKDVYFEDTRYFAWTALILCFWALPCGICAIKHANDAKYYHSKGNYQMYKSTRSTAQGYVLFTVIVGVIVDMIILSAWLSGPYWKGFVPADLTQN
eukprot:418303_1